MFLNLQGDALQTFKLLSVDVSSTVLFDIDQRC